MLIYISIIIICMSLHSVDSYLAVKDCFMMSGDKLKLITIQSVLPKDYTARMSNFECNKLIRSPDNSHTSYFQITIVPGHQISKSNTYLLLVLIDFCIITCVW